MIHLSRAAIHEVKRLQRKSPDAMLRLGVQAGGCSDFFYTLEFVSSAQSDDQLWQCDELQIVVDRPSLIYLNGLTLDYSQDLMGGTFRFDNPNAEQHCGCGNSFTPVQTSRP
jgi:iron-sulfur cluster assembly accessory protein